jgi:hypothetical protein
MMSDIRKIDLNDKAAVDKFLWRAYLKNMFYIVSFLSILSWWARGFYVAIVAGSILYGFLCCSAGELTRWMVLNIGGLS